MPVIEGEDFYVDCEPLEQCPDLYVHVHPTFLPSLLSTESLCFWCWIKEMGEQSRQDYPIGQSSQKGRQGLNLEGQQRETDP